MAFRLSVLVGTLTGTIAERAGMPSNVCIALVALVPVVFGLSTRLRL